MTCCSNYWATNQVNYGKGECRRTMLVPPVLETITLHASGTMNVPTFFSPTIRTTSYNGLPLPHPNDSSLPLFGDFLPFLPCTYSLDFGPPLMA